MVPQNLYWIGGTGNWDDITHWSQTSGGTGGYCTPTQLDNVIFDQNSFSQTGQAVFINIFNAYCRDMSWSTAALMPTFSSTSATNNLRIFGSLALNQNMNFSYSGIVYFEGQKPSGSPYTIVSSGKNFSSAVYFNGVGGEWTFLNALSISRNDLYLNFGPLNTNGKTISIRRFLSSNNNIRGLNMASSVFKISYNSNQAWSVNGSNFSIVSGTSEIRFTTANGGLLSTGASILNYNNVLFQNAGGTSILNSNHSFNSVVFNSFGTITDGGTYGKVVMDIGGQIQDNSTYGSASFYGNTTISGINTFNRLLLGPGSTSIFQSGTTQNITGRFIIWGSAANPVTIQSSVSGTQATISKTAGTVLGNYVHLKDMSAAGGATFNVYSSNDQGNNTGWNFMDPTSLTLPNTTITSGTTACFDATETITVGRSGETFIVQNGGSVRLIAGYGVHLLPGARVYAGGYLNAYCTTYGFFCDTRSTMPKIADQVAGVPDDLANTNYPDDSFFRIYPNPSNGVFTLELKESGGIRGSTIEIMTFMGERFANIDMQICRVCHINLTDRQLKNP